MGHKHSVRDTGAHFIIDQYTRQIKNDSANKTTIVQYDHNSERLAFELPLYVDGHAMTLCDLIEIHYINISTDGKSQNHGTYEVDDIKAEGENAVFTWLISQECTQLAGSLNFFIVFKCTENGVTVYRWGTEIYKNQPISEGMDNGEAILTEYPDILAQWKARIFGAKDEAVLAVDAAKASALAAIEAAGEAKKQAVLDSIPDEYEALQTGVDTLFNSVASGIRGNLPGVVVRADDVSPVEHNPMVKVHGKNLFNINALEVMPEGYSVRISAIDAETNSFTITTTETHTGNGYCGLTNAKGNYAPTLRDLCPQLKVGKTYVLSGTTDSRSTFIYLRDISRSWVFGKPLTITEECLNAKIAMYGLDFAGGEGTGDCVISNIQVEEGTTATEYTPYIDPATVRVVKCGKNLITNLGKSVEGTGIEWTKKEDGTVVANGTAETDCVYGFDVVGWNTCLVGSTVTLSGCPSGGAIEKFAVVQRNYGRFDTGSGVTFVIDNQNFSAWGIKVEAGVTVNNLVFKPQLEVGSIATVYEQHKIPTDHTPTADGNVSGMTSLSPCMTILTNTAGVTVECEYIVDTKTYIDNKIKELMEGVTA